MKTSAAIAIAATALIAANGWAQSPPASTTNKPSAVYKNPSGQDSEPGRDTNAAAKGKAPAGTRQNGNDAPATGTYTAGKKPNPATGCSTAMDTSPTAAKTAPKSSGNSSSTAGTPSREAMRNCARSASSGKTTKQR